MALSVGIVKNVEGLVIDTNSQGKERVLKVGDVVNVEDTIDTVGGASKIVLALTDGQELAIGGNDGVFLDKSVYGTESFGNDAVASSEIMKDILPGESVADIQKALLSGEDINNLVPTAAGNTVHSELGTSGEAQYLQGGSESNVHSSLRDSGGTVQSDVLSFSAVNTPDINDAPIATDDAGFAKEAGSAGDEGLYSAPLPASGNVIDNDTDIDNLHSNLSVINVDGQDVPINGDIALVGIYGTLNINSDGSYTYVANDSNQTVNALAAGESIKESFSYTLSDNDSINPKTDSANLSITINGSNDAPIVTSTVSTGSVTEDNAAQSVATGDISFSDVDLSDTHTVTSSKTSSNYGVDMGTFSVVENSDTTGSGTGGNATWTYHINNGAAQQLAAGQNVTETYNVTISDEGGKTSTQTISVTITGTNDAPILSTENTTGTVTDDASNPTLTDSGNISFTDVDLSDTHSVHVETNPDNLGTLNAVITELPNSSSGTVDWTYSVPSSQTEYLGAGETKVESFNVAVDDGQGGISIQTVNITISGTNNQPVVSDVNVNGSGFLNRFTGDSANATYYNNGSNSYNGMDHATVPDNRVQRIDSTHAQFALDTRLPSGSEDWDGARIYLHQGEVLTLTSNSGSNDYYLGIDDSDHSNGTPDPVTGAFRWDALALTTDAGQSVSLTANSDGWYYIGAGAVSGPNSPYGLYDTTVTITGETGSTIYEVDTGLNTFTSTFPSGQDADIHDTLTYDIVANSISATTSSAAVVTNLGVEVTDPNTGAYKVTGDFNSLAAGETATVTFQYTANDGHGFDGSDGVNQSSISDPATVTLTITGTNDAPILSTENTTGSVTEDASNPTLTDSGNISFTDVDLSDTHSVHVDPNSTNIGTLTAAVSEDSDSDHGTVNWSYSAPNSQTQYLAAGETKTDTFDVTVTDSNGGESTQTISVTITGTNDQPIVQDVNISTALVSQNSTDGNLGVFSGVFSETGESSPTFGGEKVSHTYNLGAEYAGKTVTINFDMKELGTWDGDGTWNHANEANIEKFITFVNGEKVIDKVMGLDGLDGNSDDGGTIISGQAGTHTQTDLHHFSIQATADANGDVTLGFGSTLHEGLHNESYSIDNILIVSGQTIYEAVNGNTVYNGNLLAATDADVGDTHTYDLVHGSEHVTSQAHITDYSINVDSDGHFTLKGDFNALSAGETATVTFQYTANDGHGFDGSDGVNQSSISDPKTVTLTIIGTNDAPVIDLDGSSNIYKESFENLIDSHGWTVIQEPAFVGDHGIAWQTEGGYSGLEVQYGNIGDSTASDGNVHAELDSINLVTLSTNVYISADTAELKFDYKPRPHHEADSNMKVTLGDHSFTIGESGIISNDKEYIISVDKNSNNGWMSVTVDATALAGGETTLTFQGLGKSDSFGAYLDNISLFNGSVSGDNGYNTTYVEDSAPIAIVDSDVVISDVDGTHINSATVTLTNAFDGDLLHVGGMPSGITASTSTDGHTITLAGNAVLSDYQDALKSITYENTSSNTNETNRVIEVVVNDGHDNSNTAISTIHVLSNTLVGGDGNDIFAYDGNPVDGGEGIDTLLFQNDDSVDLSLVASGSIKNMEVIDLTHANVSISNLNPNDVLDMTDNNNIIKIDGDSHDTISSTSTSHWTQTTGADAGYTRYEGTADNHTQVFVDIKDTIVHTDF